MKITANHAHVFQKEVREDGTVDNLLKTMDSCGIEKAVAFAPFPSLFRDHGENPNVWLHEQIKNEDRLFGFGVVDFNQSNIREQVRQISDLGLHGIKMHPAFQQFHLLCEKAMEAYGTAEELGLPVSFHTGIHWHRISDYNVLLFDEVAYHFKSLKISLEHIGGYSFFKEGLAVMANNRKHVYGGLTSVFDKTGNRLWYLGKEKVEDVIWQIGADRLLFGLDFPYNNTAQIQLAIDAVNALAATEEEKEKILGGNLLEFMKTAPAATT